MKIEILLNETIILDDVTSILEKLNRTAFYHTGSRSVLSDVPETTDWDFMCEDTDDNLLYLKDNGFYMMPISVDYMDDATSGVWYHPDAPNSVQVVTKKMQYWKTCIKMWDVFKTNPILFRDYFWKSYKRNPLERDVVRKRINAMLIFIKECEL
jgi:hypothetical protein